MLRIERLTKKFGNKTAVNQVAFDVREKEVFCLIGPNGSGKTTVIKTVAGLLKPTAGSITIGGLDSTAEPEKAKSLVGYIPDEPVVWSAVTGEEFLHIVGALYGISEQDRVRRIPGLLQLFHLEGIEKEYFEDYSRGNKQKFSVLAALLHKPKLLLVDEPIVGLDPSSAEIVKEQFVRFAEAGGSVLMVTHTLSVAEQIATRIGFLRYGKLIAVGTLHELRKKSGLGPDAGLPEVYEALMKQEV